MPVATQASLKGLTPQQLEESGCRLCLNNTYHLGLKPGQEVLEKVGGAHKLQGWKHNILTDSGGYVVSSSLGQQITCSAQLSDGEFIETCEYHRGRSAIPQPA
jgi:tRNA-guanine family transglycosylase